MTVTERESEAEPNSPRVEHLLQKLGKNWNAYLLPTLLAVISTTTCFESYFQVDIHDSSYGSHFSSFCPKSRVP